MSSDALQRARSLKATVIAALPTSEWVEPGRVRLLDVSQTVLDARAALDALLAEVARLEQKCAMWEALAEKGKEWTIAAEADLAAARAREQRAIGALREIAGLHCRMHPIAGYMYDEPPHEIARVALAAEPAATLAEGEHAPS